MSPWARSNFRRPSAIDSVLSPLLDYGKAGKIRKLPPDVVCR